MIVKRKERREIYEKDRLERNLKLRRELYKYKKILQDKDRNTDRDI